MRYAAKVDDNQQEIVDALRAAGAMVWIIRLPMDLIVVFRDRLWVVEVKNSDGRNRLQESQRKFIDATKGFDPPISGVVRSVDEALELVGATHV